MDGKPELEVMKVEQILVKIPEGEERRSRCWKVTVAPQFAEQMLKPESYPSVWGWIDLNDGKILTTMEW